MWPNANEARKQSKGEDRKEKRQKEISAAIQRAINQNSNTCFIPAITDAEVAELENSGYSVHRVWGDGAQIIW